MRAHARRPQSNAVKDPAAFEQDERRRTLFGEIQLNIFLIPAFLTPA